MKRKTKKRITITPEHIDTVDRIVTDVNDPNQILVARQQADGISEQSVRRICYGLSLAKRGIKVYQSNNIPGKDMCDMINKKYAHLIAKSELDCIHQDEINKDLLLHAFANNKNLKGLGKVNDFDKSIEECKPKVEVKSDIQYLADAIMKLVEVTETQNRIIELLINKN